MELLAQRFCPAPFDRWLVPADATHAETQARLLRNIRARALHEPLLVLVERLARRGPNRAVHDALRALLPGRPKPVAALTHADEVVEVLLRLVSGSSASRKTDEARLAGLVAFHLTLGGNCESTVVVHGPARLVHVATRRVLRVGAAQRLQLGGGDEATLILDGAPLDPWSLPRVAVAGPLAFPEHEPSTARLESARRAWSALEARPALAADVGACMTLVPPGNETLSMRELVLASTRAKLDILQLADPLTLHAEDIPDLRAGLERAAIVGWGLAADGDVACLQKACGLPTTDVGAALVAEGVRVLSNHPRDGD